MKIIWLMSQIWKVQEVWKNWEIHFLKIFVWKAGCLLSIGLWPTKWKRPEFDTPKSDGFFEYWPKSRCCEALLQWGTDDLDGYEVSPEMRQLSEVKTGTMQVMQQNWFKMRTSSSQLNVSEDLVDDASDDNRTKVSLSNKWRCQS